MGLAPAIDFNPRPPRGGRLLATVFALAVSSISIHAPREGGDQVTFQEIQDSGDISIHAPREGGDGGCWEYAAWWWLFQSTPPARGATRETFAAYAELCIISIHAPREGGDAPDAREEAEKAIFQSTPPARGATT